MNTVNPEVLKRVTVFSTCTMPQLERLVGAGQVTKHAAGDQLMEEHGVGYRFHVLLEGRAAVERGGKRISEVTAGEFVGEISLLGGGHCTATVRCSEPTTCLTVTRDNFWSLLEAEPAIGLRILEVLCRRLERELEPGMTCNLT